MSLGHPVTVPLGKRPNKGWPTELRQGQGQGQRKCPGAPRCLRHLPCQWLLDPPESIGQFAQNLMHIKPELAFSRLADAMHVIL
jgi:hypothetical protein